MYTGYYQMGLTSASVFCINDSETKETENIKLENNNFADQMKAIAPIIKDKQITRIYVSNENALPLEHMLNNILRTQYENVPHVNFIYQRGE